VANRFDKYKKHNLNLPDWGPYSSITEGASLVTDRRRGWRMDFPLSVGLSSPRRIRIQPCARMGYLGSQDYAVEENPIHAWDAEAALKYWAYRYTIDGLERRYAIAEFAPAGRDALLIALTFFNNASTQAVFFADLLAGAVRARPDISLRLRNGEIWIPGWKYEKIQAFYLREAEGLPACANFKTWSIEGKVLGYAFGCYEGDSVSYRMHIPRAMKRAYAYLRYIKYSDVNPLWRLKVCGPEGDRCKEVQFRFKRTGGDGKFWGRYFDEWEDWGVLEIYLGELPEGEAILRLEVIDPPNRDISQISLDGLLIREGRRDIEGEPLIEVGPSLGPRILGGSFPVLEERWLRRSRFFALASSHPRRRARIISDEKVFRGLDHFNRRRGTVFEGDGKNLWLDLSVWGVRVGKGSSKTIFFAVARGESSSSARRSVLDILRHSDSIIERARCRYEKKRYRVPDGPDRMSQEKMMAALLTNVVFPARVGDDFRKVFIPGKCWGECAFSWDAGFIALGLLEYNIERAIEEMNFHLTEPGSPYPLLFLGSPVPVQACVYWEIFLKTLDRDFLRFFYHRIKRMYDFLAGKVEGSAFNEHRDGVISPFRYFYNSMGWDDYPVQRYVEKAGIASRVGVVGLTCQVIRVAKILRLAAYLLGRGRDVEEFSRDVDFFTAAIERLCWDEPCGYYGWICRGERKAEIIKYEGKVNYNMGMDGIYPLVAGFRNRRRVKRLLSHLKDPSRLWTPHGISTVDRSAPYYSDEGYWNGRVWMPHQWFFWKALLSYGEEELSERIARTALEIWRREYAKGYNTWENFKIKTGEGAGWPRFSGLSSPVLNFFAAYHIPGRVTFPFDVIPRKIACSPDHLVVRALSPFFRGRAAILAVLKPDSLYRREGPRPDLLRTDSAGYVSIPLQVSSGEISLKLTLIGAS